MGNGQNQTGKLTFYEEKLIELSFGAEIVGWL
jgi:hypothetical protein